jgi:hypothetical protein
MGKGYRLRCHRSIINTHGEADISALQRDLFDKTDSLQGFPV